MHLQGMWHGFMADAGNAPGAQQGDVIVTLMEPVGGVQELTVPSNDVTIAAEAGNLIGVQLLTPEGRRLFVSAGNLAGMIDAPLSGRAREDRRDGRPAAGGQRPEERFGNLPLDATSSQDEAEREDAELEARVPAHNRTDEQQERAREREQAAERDGRQAAQDSEREERERTRDEDGDQRDEAEQRDDARARQPRPAAPGDGEVPDAATDRAEAAHDRSDAAQDREAAARDKAASRRRAGK